MKKSFKRSILRIVVAGMVLQSAQLSINAQLNGDNQNLFTESVSESSEDVAEEDESSTQTSQDWSAIEASIQEGIKPEQLTQVFQSKEALEFTNDEGLIAQIDRYALYELSDIHRDHRLLFGDQDERGAILVMEISLENQSDEAVYHNNIPRLALPGYDGVIVEASSSMANDEDLYFNFSENEQKLKPGDSKKGYLAYTLSSEAMDALEQNGSIHVEFIGFRDQADYVDAVHLLENPVFNLPFSDQATQQAASTSELFPDAVVRDNMGEKELLESAENVAASQVEEEIMVTVDGYQIAQLIPNADFEAGVEELAGGLIMVNVKVDVQNNSDKAIRLGQSYNKLVLGMMVEMNSDSMLEVNDYDLEVAPGDTGTIYNVFTMEGNMYEKFKDDTFTFVPSISNVDGEDMHEYQAILIDFKD